MVIVGHDWLNLTIYKTIHFELTAMGQIGSLAVDCVAYECYCEQAKMGEYGVLAKYLLKI